MWAKNILKGAAYILVSFFSISSIFYSFQWVIKWSAYLIDFMNGVNFFIWWFSIGLFLLAIKFMLLIFTLLYSSLTRYISRISPNERFSIAVTSILRVGNFLYLCYYYWKPPYPEDYILLGIVGCIVTFLALMLTITLIASTMKAYTERKIY